MLRFKDPELACTLFIAKVEAVSKNNRYLRAVNGELIRLLEEHEIEYRSVIESIKQDDQSDGVIG